MQVNCRMLQSCVAAAPEAELDALTGTLIGNMLATELTHLRPLDL
jgi:hypothetical protein